MPQESIQCFAPNTCPFDATAVCKRFYCQAHCVHLCTGDCSVEPLLAQHVAPWCQGCGVKLDMWHPCHMCTPEDVASGIAAGVDEGIHEDEDIDVDINGGPDLLGFELEEPMVRPEVI